MAKSAKKTFDDAVTTAVERPPKAPADAAASVTERDIARRAYDLYLARDREDGHDMDDWLQAERELRSTRRSPAA